MPDELINVMSSVDVSWSKDLIIRYLYIKIAPFFERDLSYFLASEEEQIAQYKNGFIRNGKKIVCETLVDIYVELFSSFGIEAKKIIATSSAVPLYAIIVRGDLGWFFLDPLSDLFYNQYGIRPVSFGVIPNHKGFILKQNYPFLIKLPEDYVDGLDRELHFPFFNDFFKQLHFEMSNRNYVLSAWNIEQGNLGLLMQKKIEFASDHLINLGSVSGAFERLRMYLYIFRMICDRTEKKRLSVHFAGDESLKINVDYRNPFVLEENMSYEEVLEDGIYRLSRKIEK